MIYRRYSIAKFLFLLLVAGLAGYHSIGSTFERQPIPRKKPNTKQIVATLQPFIEQLSGTDRFSGVVLIAENGIPVFLKAYGLSDSSANRPNRIDTRFNVASTTQAFTAAAIAGLAQQNKLSFDDRLEKFLPGCPVRLKAVTIHQLLTHTAGTGGVFTSQVFRQAPRRFAALADYLTTVYAEPPAGEPGGEFRYGDSSYDLLGAVIEKISGQSYYDYMRDHVFLPAGMKKTGFDLIPRPAGLAVGYTLRDLSNSSYAPRDGPRHENSLIFPARASPGAGAYSTAEDLLRFGYALLGHRLLSASYTGILEAGKADTGRQPPNQQYGYGFFDGTIGDLRIVNHGGS